MRKYLHSVTVSHVVTVQLSAKPNVTEELRLFFEILKVSLMENLKRYYRIHILIIYYLHAITALVFRNGFHDFKEHLFTILENNHKSLAVA